MDSAIETLTHKVEKLNIRIAWDNSKEGLKEYLKQRDEHQRAIEILQSANLNTK